MWALDKRLVFVLSPNVDESVALVVAVGLVTFFDFLMNRGEFFGGLPLRFLSTLTGLDPDV